MWQPIDTAPICGSSFIILNEDNDNLGWANFNKNAKCFVLEKNTPGYFQNYTHWAYAPACQ